VDRNAPFRFVNSCGLLLIPALAWNLALAEQLPPAFSPAAFWSDIPSFLGFAENVTRAVVIALPFFMPLELATPVQRQGLAVFAVGTLVYFASWLPLICWPTSAWCESAAGFMAPAYTPVLWLLGLAMVGRRLFWGRFYRWWFYLVIAALFLGAHILHAGIVFARTL
jgi:hypothetical protein